MTLKSYLFNLFAGTVFALIIFGLFFFSTDPESFSLGISASFVIFYILFFLSAAGISILSLTWLWNKMSGDEVLTVGEISMSIRQGILLGILMTLFMFFQQMRIFIWWDALLLTGGILLVELYFLTR